MRFWRFRLIVLILMGMWVVSIPSWAAPPGHRVLVLHSYSPNYQWVSSINQGLQESLDPEQWDLWFEYLDTKNHPLESSDPAWEPFLRAKYRDNHFDLVVTVDDAAYQVFSLYRKALFGDTPALALGMNSPPSQRLPGVSYFLETLDYSRTLNLALKQNPKARSIHLVLDQSLTGQIIRRNIEAASLDRPMTLNWIDEGDSEEVAARAAKVPPGEILVYALYYGPSEGYESINRVLRRVLTAARVPVYGFWSFFMVPGAFGGSLYDAQRMGHEAGDLIRSLTQPGASVIYRDDPLDTWIFDWSVARRFGISEGSFPPETRFLNQPSDFWVINRAAALTFVAVFFVLLGFTVLILFNLRTKRALLSFRETMIVTQRELMHSLGNVIERRSDETASHVQRVTALCLYIGDLLRLSREQKLQLELCSPMHDIGKVGIPDDILKKPGTLTPAEFEVMKEHTQIGYSIFCSSPNPIIQAAARIALEHHERWDGRGYPEGLEGERIDPLARIVSIVDVCDALLSERSYKEAWAPERVRAFLAEQSGQMFDPKLAALVLGHWDEFYQLWQRTEAQTRDLVRKPLGSC